jgi:quinol monooxygenase YgiN
VSQQFVTVVDAVVDQDRAQALLAGFRALVAGPQPDGLLRSELLRGQDGSWRIQSTWRDRAAVMALRASGEPPAALALLDSIGCGHTHGWFTVEVSHPA